MKPAITYEELLKENRLLKKQLKQATSESIFQHFFEKSPDAHLVIINNQITTCNRATVKLFKYKSTKEIIGKFPWTFSPKVQPDGTNSKAKAKSMILKTLEKGSHRFEWVHQKSTGETFYTEVLLTTISTLADEKIIYGTIHDITVLKKVMSSLRESEERFRLFYNMSFEGIIIHDNGIAIDINSTFEKLSGYKREDIIGQNILEKFIPVRYHSIIKKNLKKQYSKPYEVEAILKSGKIVPVETESITIKINNRNLRFTAIRDISEKKNNRIALEKSRLQYKKANELYRLMADTTPDMIWAKDMEGKFLFTNKAICEGLLNAKDINEPIGKDVMYFVNREREKHPEDNEWFTFGEECGDSDAITINNRTTSHFIEYGNVFGKYLILDVYKAPLWDENGNMIGTVGNARDVTKQLEAEEKLKSSEERYKMLFENSPDPIIIHDGKIILDGNPASFKSLGLKNKEQLIGKNVFSFVHSDSIGLSEKRLKRMLKQKSSLESIEIKIITPDKKEIIALASPSLITYNGKPAFMVIYHDITNRKKAEDAILAKEKEFHNVVESAGDAIYLSDFKTGKILLTNQQACNATGYTKEEILKMYVTDINPDFNKNNLKSKLWAKLSPGGISTLQVNHRTKDGRLFPVEVRAGLINYNGKKSILAFARDISERRKIYNALLESEERFKRLSDITFEGILIHDRGITFDLNLSLSRMFGYDKNELMGKNIIELLIAEESRKLVKQNIKKNYAESYQVTGIKKDGTRFPLEIESRNITINKKTIRVAAFRDISLRVKAEEALLRSEDKFRKAFSTSPDAVSISEMETGKYFNINKSFTEILGYNEKDTIGKTSTELGIWKEPETRNKIVSIIKTKGAVNNFEVTFINKTGEEIYGLVSGTIIELSGKPYLLTITRDITDRIKAQTILKQLNNKLKQQNKEYEKLNNDLNKSMEQIRQINRELEIAKHKAEESDRLKSAFLANMSHEIRTPMNGILGFSSLLNNTELTDKERLSYINIIDTSGKRLLNIINDLIDISKIEAGQMQVRLSECNVSKHINELNRFFSLEARQKGLELICQKTNVSEPPVITTDVAKFNAIFTNLLKNAIKYTQKGNITFGFTPKGKYLEFFVKDTGIGIPENRIKAIFDRFVQADIEDRDAYEGAGLGLAITRAYVEMLGGKIWVNSAEGKGSTFYFTLPVGGDKTITPLISTKPEPEKQEPILNVLIVEDEEFSHELLKIMLRNITNKIYFAKTGIEAIEIIKNNDDINLVLMDIKMPGIDGFETSREIRKINNDIKIIAQTAYVLKDDKEKKLENEFDSYVTKPIDKTDLLKKIKMLF